MILNPEYKELGSTAYALELTCRKCGKTYNVTKFATPPSDHQPKQESKQEVLDNIRQTTLLLHSFEDKCNGRITDREIS